ncbi:cysteine-rich with EGF-like domain protein 2-A [Orbicella faveolata]|uniref:cysteine-rich with EGF-like domain protein 2-A n=2 Tax=Orbicella faveolata TaxID=48498 RepID=UPI0009E5535D|nr:cysteine-rich with EGF-like domain protein 2-A [Orbicella faveolata]
MEISLKMSKNWIVQIVLVANILFCSGLRSAAREKKAKCPTCTDIVDAFKKGKDKTEKANFGGGNTDWEERKLGSYANSETRLVEIMEGLCDESASECHAMVEEQEETLEEWWFDQLGKDKTEKANFGGGNTDWEERKLGSYANSETRLVEIMEGLCDESASECHAMVEEQEETLEEWWFDHQFKNNDMKTWLCIDKLKVCCPDGTFGPDCKGFESLGARGDGTREGTGKCSCDSGYEGDLCDECAELYFEEQDENSKTKCTACHKSCADGCSGGSQKDCEKCKAGWEMTDEDGCKDKNECDEEDTCEAGQYCGDGTREGTGKCSCDSGYEGDLCDECAELYFEEQDENSKTKCTACHKSCADGCSGGSQKDCEKCKAGWEMTDEDGCKDKNECDEEDTCEAGQYCVNNPGSYVCEDCDDSCAGNCTGNGPKGCIECAKGYDKSDEEGCKDVDECAENATLCENGKFCDNTPGSHVCRVCHSACETCIGEGSQGCTKCNTGYKMADNECKGKTRTKILLLLILGFKVIPQYCIAHPFKLSRSEALSTFPSKLYNNKGFVLKGVDTER